MDDVHSLNQPLPSQFLQVAVVVGMSTNLMHTTREYVNIPDLFDTAKFCQALLLKR